MSPERDDTNTLFKDVHEAARADDPESAIQNLGRDLVNRVFMLYRTGKVHTMENDATQHSMEAVRSALEKLGEFTETNTLVAVGETLYLNRKMLKTEFSGFENFRFLSQLFGKLKIGGVTFRGVPTREEIATFLKAWLASPENDQSPEWIGHQSLGPILIVPPGEMEEVEQKLISSAKSLSDPAYLLRLYLKTILFFRSFVQDLQEGEFPTVSILQRSVHEFIDASAGARKPLLSLVTIHSTEEYLPYHSVNVMLLSLLLARELGLSRRYLSDLGTAALMHDIGKVQIPRHILETKMALTQSDWAQLKKSNMYSLLQLIRLKGFNESALRRMLVAYEHTLSVSEGSQPTLLARIVAIAHCYDAMATPQAYRDALLPHEIFKLMNKEEGKKFDAGLLHVFFKLMSPYPTGTLLSLSTNEIAIVVDGPETRHDNSLPKVEILYDASKNKVRRELVDLSNDDRKIVKLLDPRKYKINPLVSLLQITKS